MKQEIVDRVMAAVLDGAPAPSPMRSSGLARFDDEKRSPALLARHQLLESTGTGCLGS
jgi:hypothetical protein